MQAEVHVLTKPGPTCIEVRGVTKTYHSSRGDVLALQDLDFEIPQGQFVSVVGPSGCGKSTLLRCIAGLDLPTTGTIEVKGRRVSGPVVDLGVVFQRDVLLDWRKIIDNVLLPVEFRRLNRRAYEPRALTLLDKMGLAEFAGRYPWELSGGMRQRVAICRALLDDPDILLMDEPFGALDAMTRDELNVELQRIWSETRKTVVFITHSISEAVFLADRVIVMEAKPGRVVDVIDIDLPRPRPLSMRETREFGVYASQIREHLQITSVWKK
jgi:NitT/TauT family transport system ATP-binding protein